jgi:hypothetical protein
LVSTDCLFDDIGLWYYGDRFQMYLHGGTTYTFTMSTPAGPYLILYAGATEVARQGLDASGTTQIVYTPAATGFFNIMASTYGSLVTGAYTLTMTSNGP